MDCFGVCLEWKTDVLHHAHTKKMHPLLSSLNRRLPNTLFAGVPDSLMKPLLTSVTANVESSRHVIAANEGAAVALAAGFHLATGKTPDYYRAVREGETRARTVPLPRTAGISTSEIIARLAQRIEEDKESVMRRNDGGSTDTKNV